MEGPGTEGRRRGAGACAGDDPMEGCARAEDTRLKGFRRTGLDSKEGTGGTSGILFEDALPDLKAFLIDANDDLRVGVA